jgi:hypothetical protein
MEVLLKKADVTYCIGMGEEIQSELHITKLHNISQQMLLIYKQTPGGTSEKAAAVVGR